MVMVVVMNDIKELLARAILGSAHKLRKVLCKSTKLRVAVYVKVKQHLGARP